MKKVDETFPKVCEKELKGYDLDKTKFIANGTVGSVFMICKKKGSDTCHAVKVEKLGNNHDRSAFLAEVKMQKEFEEYAPKVHYSKMCNGYGIVIMDKIEETLDEYLSKKKDANELKAVVTGLKKIFIFLKKKRYTHGDTALFNIASVKNSKGKRKWIMIDFDRSSVENKFYDKDIDILRFCLEFIGKFSLGTKRINAFNRDYIISNLILKYPSFKKVILKYLNDAWVDGYETYCKETNVKCIRSDI